MSEYIKEIKLANEVLIPEIVEFLNEGHTVTLRLRGYSMRPFLEDNRDKALLIKAVTFKKGDAVLAEVSPRHYVLHRVIKINGDDVVLRGDGNIGCEYCKRSDVKGFVVGFYRKGSNKIDKTNSFKWRAYSCVWCFLYPVRRYLLFAYRLKLKIFG
ncbi:MAG: S24/S26 family peptidase [Prevotella sp.]|jgi:hypothetical protein|nr:S24/S26 family peptidase [Prevotella sp.]